MIDTLLRIACGVSACVLTWHIARNIVHAYIVLTRICAKTQCILHVRAYNRHEPLPSLLSDCRRQDSLQTAACNEMHRLRTALIWNQYKAINTIR